MSDRMGTLSMKTAEPSRKEPAATLLFGGDFCPTRRFEKKILEGGEVFPPEMRAEIARSDLFIVNLEAPLCDDCHNSERHGGGLGVNPAVARHFQEMGVDAVGLANNHILDKGDRGLVRTLDALKENGVAFFGAGRNIREASKPFMFAVGGLRIGVVAAAERELSIAGKSSAGAALFDPVSLARRVGRLRKSVDFLVCYVHAGHEFMLTPSPRIRAAYRMLIDSGADAVVGHHPHVPQGVEEHGGGWIFYSLGNLVFDSDYVSAHENTDLGFLARLKIGRRKIFGVETIPFRITPKKAELRSIKGQELAKYAELMDRLSRNIKTEKTFLSEWEKNVATRWRQEYRTVFESIPERLVRNPDRPFLSIMSNLLNCPTHNEFFNAALDLLKEGATKASAPARGK